MIDGRRVTDAETLKVVTMVYAGLVNKTIVAALQARDINAIGVCGADAGIILSNKRPANPIDYGYVGDVVKVDGDMLASLLQGGTYPVVAPITHDGKGNLLGGFTAQKFDCSSLIQYIFYKGANELLGVHTRAQVLQGKHVKKSDLQRGDCIFFTNEQRQYNKGIERVGHVALYLGDGYILHTASDYARIEKISNKRWSFYIEARRFL
jgi:hypothetical protein